MLFAAQQQQGCLPLRVSMLLPARDKAAEEEVAQALAIARPAYRPRRSSA